MLANNTEKLYSPSQMNDDHEFDEFYVRHMHNRECPGHYSMLPFHGNRIYLSETNHLMKEDQFSIETYSVLCLIQAQRYSRFITAQRKAPKIP